MPRLILKSAILLAALGGLGILATRFLRHPGAVEITWGGWIIELHAVTLLAAIAVVVFALWFIFSAIGALLRAPSAISEHLEARRHRRGLVAFSDALVAWTAGDAASALTAARRAEHTLQQPQLTRPLMARVLAQNGQDAEASRYFRALADDPKTAVVGLRGLFEIAERTGDRQGALRHAKRAVQLRPRDPWALGVLFDWQTRDREWSNARQTLQALQRVKAVEKNIARHQEAVLLTAEAAEMEAAGNAERAKAAALDALSLDHGNGPAAAIAARLLIQAGERRQAERTLRQAWRAEPVPEVAAAWAALAPDEDAETRSKRFARLTDSNPNHVESRLLSAELAIARRDFPAAKAALGEIAQQEPSARVCAILAAIEKAGNNNDAAAREWLTRALSAKHGRGWHCTTCGIVQDQWRPLCPDCHAFDTIRYGSVVLGGNQAGSTVILSADKPVLQASPTAAQTESSQPSDSTPATPPTSGSNPAEQPEQVVRPDA